VGLKFSFDKLTQERFIDFINHKGWVKVGHWQKKIDYYSSPKYTERLSVYIDENMKDLRDRRLASFAKLVEIEDIDTADMEKQYMDFIEQFGEQLIMEAFVEDVVDNAVKLDQAQRKQDGTFAKGNTIGVEAAVIGVSSLSIRRHRAFINDNIPQLLRLLMDEAINNKNTSIAMWLVAKIVPDTKASTFTNVKVMNGLNTLNNLKEQSSHTIKEASEGGASLEEADILMGLYKEHKSLIEAADIEPLAIELSKRTGRVYGQA
jgi:hypothetical protein